VQVSPDQWRYYFGTGIFSVTVTIDPYNRIPESDETNNTLTKTFEVSGVPTLTEWGLIVLVLVLLALATWVFFWRRRKVVGVGSR
jgi:apolipoprotein N-acyltransferase